jgi:hypothetical protein
MDCENHSLHAQSNVKVLVQAMMWAATQSLPGQGIVHRGMFCRRRGPTHGCQGECLHDGIDFEAVESQSQMRRCVHDRDEFVSNRSCLRCLGRHDALAEV